MPELNPQERSRRYYADAVTAARTQNRYEREASVDELLADLAMLRAIGEATDRRRSIYGGLMGAAVLIAVLAAGAMHHDQIAPFILVLPVLFVLWLFRRFTRAWESRRIDLAAVLLRRLDVSSAKLRLDLDATDSRRFRVEHSGAAKRYLNPWLSLDTVLPDGKRLELVRTEQCDYTHQSYGRRQVFTWAYAFEDALTVHGVAAAPPALKAPERFTLRALEANDGRVTLKMASALRWEAEPKEGSLDASEVILTWLGLLGARPPGRLPKEPVTAHVWAIGPRGIGWLLLFLSAAPAVGAAVLLAEALERVERGSPVMSVGQFGESALLGVPAVLLWGCAAVLWTRPRRRARA
ncbi:MAG: hypothetical protein JNK82_37520 [Myxococcaceae bacterium]|nr:hypothetical protein [Myxococcaceae bacterium]